MDDIRLVTGKDPIVLFNTAVTVLLCLYMVFLGLGRTSLARASDTLQQKHSAVQRRITDSKLHLIAGFIMQHVIEKAGMPNHPPAFNVCLQDIREWGQFNLVHLSHDLFMDELLAIIQPWAKENGFVASDARNRRALVALRSQGQRPQCNGTSLICFERRRWFAQW
mmetsp:Transcript_106727/g.211949  ORF Transcript_106727/g.211949 Transcript_106727/m.211949 type:complete len:166 (-) Transcript_106727:31-528(-)